MNCRISWELQTSTMLIFNLFFNEVQGKHSLQCTFSVVSDGFLPDTFQNPLLEYYHFQNRGQLKYTESAQNCCVFLDSHLSAHFVHAMCFLGRFEFHCVRNRFGWYVFYACLYVDFICIRPFKRARL